jgi:hypothetical protein
VALHTAEAWRRSLLHGFGKVMHGRAKLRCGIALALYCCRQSRVLLWLRRVDHLMLPC